MGGHALLGDAVHLLGADLNLDEVAARPGHGGVQRLVVVRLGRADEILDPARHRRPVGVHRAQGLVALLDRAHDDAEGHLVVHPLQRDLLHQELLVDGIQMLGPADDTHRHHPRRLELAVEDVDHLVHVGLALAQRTFQAAAQIGPLGRVEVAEGQVLKFPFEPLDPDAAGQRRVQVHGLAGLVALFLRADRFQGEHVLQPVGQPHEQHADVRADGEQQLADVLSLVGELGIVADVGDAGGAVDDVGHLAAEQLFQFLAGGDVLLEGAVEQAGDDGVQVEPHGRQGRGHRQQVVHVGFARFVHMVGVTLADELVGPEQGREVHLVQVGRGQGEEVLDVCHRCCVRSGRAPAPSPGFKGVTARLRPARAAPGRRCGPRPRPGRAVRCRRCGGRAAPPCPLSRRSCPRLPGRGCRSGRRR